MIKIKDNWIKSPLLSNTVYKTEHKLQFLSQSFDFLIPIFLQPNVVDLQYFKLWILQDYTVFKFESIKGKYHHIAIIQGLENLYLWVFV